MLLAGLAFFFVLFQIGPLVAVKLAALLLVLVFG